MGNEFQKEAFVGKKYEKIMRQKFSVPTLFLGSLYWAYRKMILEAFGLLAVKSIITFILSAISTPIVENIVRKDSANSAVVALIAMIIIYLIVTVTIGIFSGFIFRTLYEKFVERTVRKIVDKDVSDSEYEETEKCRKKGGTSILFAILFFFISGTISGMVTAKESSINVDNSNDDSSYVLELDDEDDDEEDDVDDEDKDEKDEKDDEDKEDEKSPSKTQEMSYEEYEYKIFTDIDISDYIELDAPTELVANTENDYIIEYTHRKARTKDIEFSIAMVDTDSAEDFIEDLTKKNGLSTTEDMYSADLDGITWYIVGFMLDDNEIYYNAFEKNDKVFLYRYQMADGVDDSLTGTYEDVILSIKYINKDKKEVEKTGNSIKEDEEDDDDDDKEDTNTTSKKSNNTSSENTTTKNTTNTSSDEDDDENTNTTSKNTNTSKSNSNTNTNSSNTSITITPTNVSYNRAD